MVVDDDGTSPGRARGNGTGGPPHAARAAGAGASAGSRSNDAAAPSSPSLKEEAAAAVAHNGAQRQVGSPSNASMASTSPPPPPPSRRRSGSGGSTPHGTPHVSQRLGVAAPTSPFPPNSTALSPTSVLGHALPNPTHDADEAFRLSSSSLPQLVLPPADEEDDEEEEDEENETAAVMAAGATGGEDAGAHQDEEDSNSEEEEEEEEEEEDSSDEEVEEDDTETETETETDDVLARMVDPRRYGQQGGLEPPSITLGGRLMWRDEQHGLVEGPTLPGLDSMGLRLRRPQQHQQQNGSTGPSATQTATATSSSAAFSPARRTPQDLAGAHVVVAGQTGGEEAGGKEAWVCPVCLQNFDEPFSLPQCTHTFCKGCIQGIVRNTATRPAQPDSSQPVPPTTPHCPLCRLEFTPADVRPNHPLFHEMQDARIRCPNPRCGAIYSPLQTKRHQDECPYAIALCHHQPHGCTFRAPRKDLPAHLALCPYEQIKGLFPKIRQSNEHVTAAMRGWENAFLSQQQMLATHTALLRSIDRRSHHNPWHHLQLVGALFWEPYLWLAQRERWTRTFSPFVTAMLAYLLPVLLALLRVATRGSPEDGLRLFYPPSPTYPPPVIGANCFSTVEGDDERVVTGMCVAGLAPQLAWVALVLVVALAFVEGHDEDKWLVWGQVRLCPASTTPSPPSSAATAAAAAAAATTMSGPALPSSSTAAASSWSPPTTPSSASSLAPIQLSIPLPAGHMLLEFCTAWACYALGGGRGRLRLGRTVKWWQVLPLRGLGGAVLVRYGALGLSLIPALAIQSIAPRCKFQKPVLQGLVLGLCMYMVEWRALAGSILLEAFLSHGFGYLFGEHFIQTFRARAVPVGPRYTEFLRRHSEQRGAPYLGVLLFGFAAGMLFWGARWALVQGLVLQNLLQSVAYTCLILLDRFMQRAQRVPRPPNWSAVRLQQQQQQNPHHYALLMASRALLVTSLVGMTLLAFF